MTITLSDKDKRMLDGEFGRGCQMAMSILVRMADVYGASELMDISQSHIDGCGLMSDAGLEFAEKLAAAGGKVSVPTTLNMGPLDLQDWPKFVSDKEFAAKATRQGKAYTDMGCVPTWSCAPYQGYLTPRFGQQVAWGESNAICYANSVIGARTNRYADYLDICAAIAGRVPKCGLHLTENRRGRWLLRLVGFPASLTDEEVFFPVLGHLIGGMVHDNIPVIEGVPTRATDDDLKAFCAAAASAGSLALFHAVGITPEAPTTDAALQNQPPERTIDITPDDWYHSWEDLAGAEEGEKLDVVVLGCPHLSFREFRSLVESVRAVAPQTAAEGVDVVLLTCQQSLSLVDRTDWQAELEAFGAVHHARHVRVPHADDPPRRQGADDQFRQVCVLFARRAGRESRVRFHRRLRALSRGRARCAEASGMSEKTATRTMQGRAVVPGSATGEAVVSSQPISLWGGLDAKSGEVIDRRHDCSGRNVTGKVFVFPWGKGSSTGSAILLEAVRRGKAPAGIVNCATDAIAALGSIVADELYSKPVPIVVLSEEDFRSIADGDRLTIAPDGAVTVEKP